MSNCCCSSPDCRRFGCALARESRLRKGFMSWHDIDYFTEVKGRTFVFDCPLRTTQSLIDYYAGCENKGIKENENQNIHSNIRYRLQMVDDGNRGYQWEMAVPIEAHGK